MKNLHILPTSQPSRLHFDSELFISPKIQLSKSINSIVEGRNTYITSDEEIKKENWVYNLKHSSVRKIFLSVNGINSIQKEDRKIILTTDQDLIQDGIQPIDDEFLDWFVKNPSCEWVEVESLNIGNGKLGYVICKPQEEPKQETLEEAAENYTIDFATMSAFKLGAKWQQERSYSEEDMQDFAKFCLLCKDEELPYIFPKDWFKHIKNKIENL
jgi:hypothetical protein